MSDFRELLYRNYSDGFDRAKTYDLELAFRMFDAAGRLPPVALDAPIADLGCGKGEWLAWLQRQGFKNVRGFDWSAAELANAKNVPVECGEVTAALANVRWESHFALLHAKDIIEHLAKQEVVDFLRACFQALQPGGFLWISTFNAQGIFSTATRYGDFTHESGFTPMSMGQVLRACGFEVASVRGTHLCPATLSGTLRRWLWRAAAAPAEMILRARHGGRPSPGIDTFSVDPDLFAIARRPEG
jgi:2-polyprenyl-3-methyl-5-hydroxy-6-metoxy-1,4-benzoquinol methylase